MAVTDKRELSELVQKKNQLHLIKYLGMKRNPIITIMNIGDYEAAFQDY